MNVLAISGSLRARSSGAALLDAAVRLAPAGMKLTRAASLGQLPHFNPDRDDAPPLEVVAWRARVAASDGLLICSPEYAHGIAGVTKNALDWLVSETTFAGKPVAVLNAAPRSTHADASLREVLVTMSAQLVEVPAIAAAGLEAEAIVADGALAAPLREGLRALQRAIEVRRLTPGR